MTINEYLSRSANCCRSNIVFASIDPLVVVFKIKMLRSMSCNGYKSGDLR